MRVNLDGKPITPEPKCKHCGKAKGDHLATTFNCPFGRSRLFPQFGKQTYEPKELAKRNRHTPNQASHQAEKE